MSDEATPLAANPRAIPFAELSRALIIKLRHHGDVLLASPVFSALKHAAPQCEIDALVYRDTAPMLEGHPAIGWIHTVERKRGGACAQKGFAREWQLLRRLWLRNYDLIIHLTESWRGAWLTRFLRPRFSVALLPSLHPPPLLWRGSFTHLAPLPPLGNRHTVECHLDALRILGFYPSLAQRRLVFAQEPQAVRRIEQWLVEMGGERGRLIHVHPVSRWMFKSWSVESFVQVIDALQNEGYRVVLTSGQDEREMAVTRAIGQRCQRPPFDLSGQLTLKELAALLAVSRISLCVDSAPMHLAAAVGTPVVALFGPSNEHEWGPWMVPHRIVRATHPCRPCRLDGCGGGKIADCLMAIDSSSVLQAIHDLLAETR